MSRQRSLLLSLLLVVLLCSSLLIALVQSAVVKPPTAKLRGVKIHRVGAATASAAPAPTSAGASGVASAAATLAKPSPHSSVAAAAHVVAASVPAAAPTVVTPAAASAAAAAPIRARPSTSLSLPGVASSEVALRLLLNKESHMAELGPTFLFAVGRFFGYLAFGLLFAVWWMQGSLLYMPSFGRANEPRTVQSNPRSFRSPAEYGLRFEEIWLRARDGVLLHSWLVLQPEGASATAPTLVFFHGNAGNIGYRLPNLKALYHQTRCNIFIVEYRGYGNSEGEPSQAGLIMDAEAAIEYLRHGRSSAATGAAGAGAEARSDIDVSRIHLFGRSLGGAVALHLAAADADAQRAARRSAASRGSLLSGVSPPLAGVIVENTFLTLTDMVLVLAARIGLIRAAHAAPVTAAPSASASHTHAHTHHGHHSGSKAAALWRYALAVLMTNHWDNAGAVSRIEAPLLFVSGLADELIPAGQMAALYARASGAESRVLHTVESGTHNDTHIRGGAGYFEQLHRFFASTQSAQQDRERNRGIHIASPGPAAIQRA